MDTLRRTLILGSLAAPALAASAAMAQTAAPDVSDPLHAGLAWPEPAATLDLWPKGVSGQLHPDMQEHVEETSTDPKVRIRRVQGISRPRVAVFPAKNPNGGAMLIIPGGGFSWNYFDHEGYQLADYLNQQGITCFVLFYRLANDGWDKPAEVGVADAQRAMRLIRAHAADYAIDAHRLGVIGFSAGGFLVSTLATRFDASFYTPVDAADTQPARPFIAAPIYPVQSVDPAYAYPGVITSLFGGQVTPQIIKTWSPDQNVGPDTAPCFLCQNEDDTTVPVENSVALRNALAAAKIPVETHLFARGGHGFGMKDAPDQPWHIWPQLFANFARSRGLMG
ncbi:alpha/beta hydrolase [Asticcacaulis sp. EMRT-3]|uniref:alpha/beta hydrolase n=1 Tax=Asticcacaulis sp. EMRT-3 TaxID=3040349 RepID=UPI0024AFFB3A|nr:alpha/beta hydrolase [Asticcacaulis sp. EMRT-3]MDI7775992.1 alpha/beta hydrolase [Asticcacaulis sp. EMRT-3]